MLDFTYPRYKVERIPTSAFNAACARVSALTRCIWSIPTWAVWSPITRSA